MAGTFPGVNTSFMEIYEELNRLYTKIFSISGLQSTVSGTIKPVNFGLKNNKVPHPDIFVAIGKHMLFHRYPVNHYTVYYKIL
jgi:hypothetical protein